MHACGVGYTDSTRIDDHDTQGVTPNCYRAENYKTRTLANPSLDVSSLCYCEDMYMVSFSVYRGYEYAHDHIILCRPGPPKHPMPYYDMSREASTSLKEPGRLLG